MTRIIGTKTAEKHDAYDDKHDSSLEMTYTYYLVGHSRCSKVVEMYVGTYSHY
jgi:hypothetical protein